MANFAIKLPETLLAVVKANTEEINAKRGSGEYSSYPEFVNKLQKGMDTPAEELHHAATGMAGETGEILDITKKVWIYNKPLDVEHLIEELGDQRFYYQATLNMLGLSDADIQAANTVKLRKRYPDGIYSDAAAQARADKQPEALSANGSKPANHEPPEPRKFIGVNGSHPETKK